MNCLSGVQISGLAKNKHVSGYASSLVIWTGTSLDGGSEVVLIVDTAKDWDGVSYADLLSQYPGRVVTFCFQLSSISFFLLRVNGYCNGNVL